MSNPAGAANGKTCGIIQDGYSCAAYIAEVPRLYPALRFTFRPALAQDRAVIFRAISQANDPRKEETLAAQAVAQRVSEWDLRDGAGCPVPISASSVLTMKPKLFNRLFRIVMGDEAPDEDPAIGATERNEQAEADLQRALAGTTAEESETKNSAAA